MEPFKVSKYKDYTLNIFKEDDPESTDYKYYAEVTGLHGCFITGDSEKEILREAGNVIGLYLEAREAVKQEKPRLVSVKFKPELYAEILKFASDEGIESVSTFVRSAVVRYMRSKGRRDSSSLAVSPGH